MNTTSDPLSDKPQPRGYVMTYLDHNASKVATKDITGGLVKHERFPLVENRKSVRNFSIYTYGLTVCRILGSGEDLNQDLIRFNVWNCDIH